MHFLVPIVVTAFLVTPAQAQKPPASQPPATTTAPVAATPSAVADKAPASAPRTTFRRQTLLQRFDEANTTKDGHLTQDQASATRWSYITRNFDAMDKDHKGFVTVDDIRAFARERRAARQTQKDPAATHG
jgi:hypothetical protein